MRADRDHPLQASALASAADEAGALLNALGVVLPRAFFVDAEDVLDFRLERFLEWTEAAERFVADAEA